MRAFRKPVLRRLFALVPCLLIALAAAAAEEKLFKQTNNSMDPTIVAGEKFAVDMDAYRTAQPARGDVIVLEQDGILVVKRVAAVGDDTIEGKAGQVFLNGKLLDGNSGRNKAELRPEFSFLDNFGPIKVPAGQFFVLGDNRAYSRDSRDPAFGLVPATQIRGRAVRIARSHLEGRTSKPIK
ncbi:MAG TPA: signal peptidase I [Terriglobales bacterium]|nr:signal peptidase I [Terriglobales bacterium]